MQTSNTKTQTGNLHNLPEIYYISMQNRQETQGGNLNNINLSDIHADKENWTF